MKINAKEQTVRIQNSQLIQRTLAHIVQRENLGIFDARANLLHSQNAILSQSLSLLSSQLNKTNIIHVQMVKGFIQPLMELVFISIEEERNQIGRSAPVDRVIFTDGRENDGQRGLIAAATG